MTYRIRAVKRRKSVVVVRWSVRAMMRVFDVHLERRQFVKGKQGMKGFVNEDDGDESRETFLGESRDKHDEETEIERHAQQQ